jgi:hypothetical protein
VCGVLRLYESPGLCLRQEFVQLAQC